MFVGFQEPEIHTVWDHQQNSHQPTVLVRQEAEPKMHVGDRRETHYKSWPHYCTQVLGSVLVVCSAARHKPVLGDRTLFTHFFD